MAAAYVLRLGRFSAEQLLGGGGTTETYRARLAEPPRGQERKLFALKLLRADRGGDDPEVVVSFLKAARRLQALAVTGVAPVVEVGERPGEIFAVSDLVDGVDLAAVRDKRVDAQAAALLGAQIAERLDGLHGAGLAPLVHGGLCPGNVVVTQPGEVILLDCGLTAAVRALTENPIEKWLFAAPELLLGDAPTVASDLYGLGALLCFLVTGRPPFHAESRDGLAEAAGTGPPPLPGAPPWLAAVVRRLLAAVPADRPARAADIAQELNAGMLRGRIAALTGGEPQARQRLSLSELFADTSPPGSTRDPTGAIVLPVPIAAGAGPAGAAGRWLRAGRMAAMTAGAALLVAGSLIAGSRWFGGGRAEGGASSEASPDAARPQASGARDGAAETQPAPPAPGEVRIFTDPPGAAVWIDGVEIGRSPLHTTTAPEGHRVVLVLPGFRTHRELADTRAGIVIQRELAPVIPRVVGPITLTVHCRTEGKFPVFVDGKDTGLVCPADGLKIDPGTRMIGLFVIPQNKIWSFERDVGPNLPTYRVVFDY